MTLTVFLISAGSNPNFTDTLKALKREQKRTPFALKQIVDVAPMSAAFQRMLDECETPYFVQIDEDMLLEPGAIETMLSEIQSSGEHTAMIAFQLYDCHLRRDIYGVKIYKHDIFKRYPFDLSSPSCEMQQLDRMAADGYGHATDRRVLGKHAVKWSQHGIFERTQNLMEKWKLYRYAWLEELPQLLWARLKGEPNDQNLYAFLGAYTSLISKEPLLTGEKDWKHRCREESVLDSWLHGPYYATLYLTSRCNFRCPFCKRETCNPNTPDMPIEVVGDLLARFPSIRSVCLCGFGEPLMHENLKPIFQYLAERKLTIGLITNGSLLKSVFLPNLVQYDCRPHYVGVSLNASTRKEHRHLTGSDTWDEIREGIRLTQQRGIPVYLSRVCTTQNMNTTAEFLNLAKSWGISTVHLHNLLPYCKEIEGVPFLELVLRKHRDEQLIEAVKQCKDAGIVTTWPTLIDPDEKPQWCEHPYRFVGVDGNGHITLCNSVDHPNPAVHVKGDIWHSQYAEDLRERVRTCGGPCQHCFRNWMVT